MLKTFEEYKLLFEEKDKFLVLQAEEITTGFEDNPVHLNATNIQNLIVPYGGNSMTEILQNNINAVLKQREETGVPILPHINHPNFHFGISAQDIIDLKGECFFEVYNGHPAVNNFGDSTYQSTEAMWDLINIAYIDKNQPLLYGIATDDSHNYHLFGTKYSNAGRGWVMVYADSLEAGSLIKAMEEGQFYAFTGVTLDDVSFHNNILKVVVNTEPEANYEIQFIGVYQHESQSKILKKKVGKEGRFKITNDLRFVRIKVVSNKLKSNPFQAGEYEVAWTQPVIPK